jgi:hypothetical protein
MDSKNYSHIIYKYRSWKDQNHKACLVKNSLFYASPTQINDPFDFKITIDYSFLDNEEKRNKYIDTLIADSGNRINPNHPFVWKRREELLRKFRENPEALQNEFDAISENFSDRRYGVISFSQRWDSILMWTHYSDNHKGFCIGYNRKKFEMSNLYGACGVVHYSDLYPKVDPLDYDFLKIEILQTHTKASDWQYEKEYRLVKIFEDEEVREIHIPDDFIEEVIIGLNTSRDDYDQINEICKKKNIPLFKVRKKQKAFLFERDLL